MMFSKRRLLRGLIASVLLTHVSIAAIAATTPQQQPGKRLKLDPTQTAVYVTKMHCKTCAQKIARKLYALKGVSRVSTNVKDDLAIVTPQRKKTVAAQSIWSAVQAAGFEPVKLIGPDGAYVPDKKTNKPVKIAEAKPAAPRG